jgi:hypothetical protein
MKKFEKGLEITEQLILDSFNQVNQELINQFLELKTKLESYEKFHHTKPYKYLSELKTQLLK